MKLYLLILISLSLLSCTSFSEVSGIANSHDNIIGTYLNDCDSVDDSKSSRMEYYLQLWKIIDRKYEATERGLYVRITETSNNKLIAQLMKNDIILSEKLIRGDFRKNQCYYKRRTFYIVPIIPFLWWYRNKQTRFYSYSNYLIAETVENTGGAFLIMAGGTNNTAGRYYRRIFL